MDLSFFKRVDFDLDLKIGLDLDLDLNITGFANHYQDDITHSSIFIWLYNFAQLKDKVLSYYTFRS